MTFKLIIFDLDGTLIDSVPDLTLAVNMMLGKIGGVPVTVADVRSWVGNGSMTLVERVLSHQMLPCDDARLHIAHELFLNSYAHNVCRDTTAYAGVHEGLDRLRAVGLSLAICTNKPMMFLPEILTHMGWDGLFVKVLAGDSLAVKKPDPAPLLHLCDKLNIHPDETLMVGDSKNDIQAGKAAGMTTLAVSYGYNYHEPITASAPDVVFDDFTHAVAWILERV